MHDPMGVETVLVSPGGSAQMFGSTHRREGKFAAGDAGWVAG